MTKTSNFGVGPREGHDASPFYDRFHPPVVSDDDQVLAPQPLADPFFTGDARHMDGIADGSVALVVTSPPYFAGKQYEEELERDGVPSTYLEYLEMLRDVFAECVRKLEPGGRLAVNVANLGRKPYRSLSADVIRILEDDLGLLLRGEIIWRKAEGAGGSCAWGSFRSASNPVLRDVTERIVVASKGRFDRAKTVKQRTALGLPNQNTLMTDDFLELTLDVWSIQPESAKRVGHPAPFPVELPEQLIRLYTFADDLVVDPFMGSGSSLVAAARLGRRYAGYDLDPDYVEIARRRVGEEVERAGRSDDAVALDDAVAPDDRDPGDHAQAVGASDGLRARAMDEGRAAHKIALDAIEEAGFTIVDTNTRIPRTGVILSFVAEDVSGRRWFFDVAGPFTSHRGGLLRADVVWRALGRASAIRGREPDTPLVLLTTDLPKRRSEGDTALRAAGPGVFLDVIDVLSVEGRQRLRHQAHARGTDHPIAIEGFWTAHDLEQTV